MKSVSVMLMEVNIKYVTFTRASVVARMALKVPNVINAKVVILDSRRLDAKVSFERKKRIQKKLTVF